MMFIATTSGAVPGHWVTNEQACRYWAAFATLTETTRTSSIEATVFTAPILPLRGIVPDTEELPEVEAGLFNVGVVVLDGAGAFAHHALLSLRYPAADQQASREPGCGVDAPAAEGPACRNPMVSDIGTGIPSARRPYARRHDRSRRPRRRSPRDIGNAARDPVGGCLQWIVRQMRIPPLAYVCQMSWMRRSCSPPRARRDCHVNQRPCRELA